MLRDGIAAHGRAALGAACLAAATLVLGGCDQLRLTLYPTPPPTPAQVAEEYTKFEKGWADLKLSLGANATDDDVAAAYVSTGYARADKACNYFFTNLRKLRNDTSMAKDATRDLAASAGIITSLATVPTALLTGMFGATGAFPGVVDDFQKTFLFAEAGDSLYPLVSSMMARYRVMFPVVGYTVTKPDGKNDPRDGATRLNATVRVRQHATLCSVPYLTYVLKTGVLEISKEAPTKPADGAKPGDKGIVQPAAEVPADKKVIAKGGATENAPVKIQDQTMGAQ